MDQLFNPMALPIFACLIMTAVLGSLMRYPLPGSKLWLAACLCLVCGLALYGMPERLPDFFTIILANASFLSGMVLLYAGSRHFLGVDVPWRTLIAVLAGATLYNFVALYVYDDLRERLVVYSLIHAGLSAAYSWTIWRYWPRERPAYPYLLTCGIGVAMAILLLARAVAFALYIQPVRPADTPSNSLALLFIVLALVGTSTFVISLLLMAHDRLIAQLESMAYRDGLTGADSRAAFMNRLERQLRQPGGRALQLLLLDLDHFKEVNDTYGHAAGDAVLTHFVMLIRAKLDAHDTVGRIGGEEFAVLLADARPGAAERFDRGLRLALAAHPVLYGGQSIRYTYSAGCAGIAPHEGAGELLARADAALYAAKHSGRDRFQAADPVALRA